MVLKALRYGRLVLHLLYGVFICGIVWPLVNRGTQIRLEHNFARRLMKICRVRVSAEFESTEAHYQTKGPYLLFSNHVSWLDIFAFNSIAPVTFIAKSEIASWPLAGLLASRAGTLFIERGKRHAVRDVITKAAEVLQTDRSVMVFPEGTTGYGNEPMKFHSNFAQPAIAASVKLVPVTLQYFDAEGNFSREPAYVGDQSLLENIAVLLGSKRGFEVKLRFFSPIDTVGKTRHEVSDEAFQVIQRGCQTSQQLVA